MAGLVGVAMGFFRPLLSRRSRRVTKIFAVVFTKGRLSVLHSLWLWLGSGCGPLVLTALIFSSRRQHRDLAGNNS